MKKLKTVSIFSSRSYSSSKKETFCIICSILVAALAALMISCSVVGMQKKEAVKEIPAFNVFSSYGRDQILVTDIWFDKIEKSNIKHIIIDIHSTGATAFHLNYILERINLLKAKGVIVETRSNGLASSGGFAIFVNGTKGYRKCSKNALFMFHPLQKQQNYSSVAITNPKEPIEIALTNIWIKHLSNGLGLSEAFIKHLVSVDAEYWLTGTQMLEYNWADEEL